MLGEENLELVNIGRFRVVSRASFELVPKLEHADHEVLTLFRRLLGSDIRGVVSPHPTSPEDLMLHRELGLSQKIVAEFDFLFHIIRCIQFGASRIVLLRGRDSLEGI